MTAFTPTVLVTIAVAAAWLGSGSAVREDFGDGWTRRWTRGKSSRWVVEREGKRSVLRMTEPGIPPAQIRRPGETAVWTSRSWGDVEFTAHVRCDQDVSIAARDAILIFGWQDDTHYYYVHLAGRSDAVHNAILLVNGRDRERIDAFDPARPNPVTLADKEFHKIRVARRIASGEILVYFDDRPAPVMRAVDRTLTWGMLGVGSFDDTASFHSLSAKGERAKGTDARP
jgi:hypothetical protein